MHFESDKKKYVCYIFKAIYILPWCNGSTRAFGAFCPGSNPGGRIIVLSFFISIFIDMFIMLKTLIHTLVDYSS